MFIRSNIGLSNKQLNVYHSSMEWSSKRQENITEGRISCWKSLCEGFRRWLLRCFVASHFSSFAFFVSYLFSHHFRRPGRSDRLATQRWKSAHDILYLFTIHFILSFFLFLSSVSVEPFSTFDSKENVFFVVSFCSFYFNFWNVFYVTVQFSSHIFIYSKTVKWKTFDIFPRGIYALWFSCLIQ